ncbi:MAG: 30S ribosomal protein S15 [Bacteriovoracaceae bacterium]|nr:30S ribosomal protein S15 [Bacteriovoracaceae bacterium]
MITKEKTQELIKKFGKSENDAGSAQVQVAILTTRINNLRTHFDKHIHDYHSNRGLLKMIGSRRRLLRYVAKQSQDNYKNLIKELGLRK